MQATQSRWDAEKVRTLEAQGEQILIAQQREGELRAQMDNLKRTHRDQTTRIAAAHADLVDSLRQRPDRPSAGGLPEAATAGAGCTGAGLFGPDARFLAGLAADAARLQAGFDSCKAAYDQIAK
jgi:hypothetical protein